MVNMILLLLLLTIIYSVDSKMALETKDAYLCYVQIFYLDNLDQPRRKCPHCHSLGLLQKGGFIRRNSLNQAPQNEK